MSTIETSVQGFRPSPQQVRLWSLQQAAPALPLHAWCEVRLRGRLDRDALQTALTTVAGRHEILRTRLQVIPGVGLPVQVVDEDADVALEFRDLEGLAEAGPGAERGGDGEEGPVLRAALLRLAADDHLLRLELPAVCADLHSLDNLVSQVGAAYGVLAAGGEPEAEEPVQYIDFSEWLNEMLVSEESREGREFWGGRTPNGAAGAPVLEPLPGDLPETAAPTGTQRIALDPGVVRALDRSADAHGVSAAAWLLAAWQVLLFRHAGRGDFTVGVGLEGRTYEEFNQSLGPFSRYVPVPAHVREGEPFHALAAEVEAALEEARGWQDFFTGTPGGGATSAAAHPDWGFDFAAPPPAAERRGEVTWTVEQRWHQLDHFRLRLSAERIREGGDEEVRATLYYDTAAQSRDGAERLLRRFEVLLRDTLEAPGARVDLLGLLDEGEREEVLRRWNATAADLPADAAVHRLFRAQAARTPGAAALGWEGGSLTFAELDAWADRLVHGLRARGVGTDARVGLLLERSPEMVAAILAVLRAGGAYVPLDPGYPAERLRFMAADAGLALVVAQPGLETRLGADAPAPLASPAELEADAPAGAFPEMEPSPRSAAYVIYTSGSTGTPKGVVVEHHGLANQMEWIRQRFPLGADDVVLQKTPFHFDASVWEIFAPLLAGARLELAPQGSHADAAWLAEAVAARGVTVLQVVPTQLRLVLAGPGIAGWSGLRRLFSGGEPLTADLCDAVCRDLPGVELVNLYGPTETTVQVAYWEVGTAERGAAPIGRPVANARLYVLDGSMHPVPAGVRGELYVGGVGVGRGYLGRPELTAERFLPDPFGGEAGGRLYRTRDLASRRLDGALEYLGRADGQVKVRGFRVELGEVEAALMRHPSVRAAVVAVRADGRGEARLVGWWAPREGAAPASAAELREALLGELPPYMVPAALMQLAAFPLLPSGKTDRAALPEPEEAASAQAYEPPATAAEEALALVWAEVLGVECVGALDNFFAMGGDSIQSVRVVGMARDRGLRLSVQDVFEAQTVRELARKAGHGASEAEALEAILRRDRHPFDMVAEADRARLPDDATDAYPLAALQAGMLYHQGLSRDGAPPYHNINSYHFRGPFDEECFREAVRLSTARHENLRTSIHLGGFGEPLQVVHAHAEVPIRVTDLRHLDEDAQARELDAFRQAEFGDVLDLARAPLMRLHVHRRADDRFQLTLTECHAIADGWSTASLFADVFGDYAALLRGEPAPEREQPAVRFRDFVELERSLSEGEAGRRFWAERLDGFVPGRLPRLPEAFRDPSRTGTWNGHIPLALEKRAALQELARSLAVPLKSVLLAAHLKVLSLLTGERDVVTGFPANGRPEVTGGTDVRGLFLNNVPLRVVLRDQSWQELVRQVFREEMDILPHRRYPLALLQREHGPDRLFDASFNLVRFHSFSSVVQEGVVQVLGNTDLADTSHTLLAGASLHPVTAEIRGLPVQLQASEFSPEQMEAVPGYYLRVLEAMLADPAARHDSLQVLAPEEVERLLAAGSGGAPARAAGACLHESFAERARLAPDAVAVTSDGGSLTYGELDGWSNRLANHLRGRGVGPETRVGICMDRSLELVAAVLGVLKAGGAYVPLDPDYPAERLAFLLEDSGAALVLTRDDVTGRLPDTVPALSVDAERDRIAREDPAAPDVEVDPENLAYVIYTSGSTGRPKGVQVTHANVARLFTSTREWFGFGEDDVWTLFHSYAFDFSVWEIWGALLHGGRLVVVPHLVSRAPDAFHRLLVAEGVTVLSQTPSAFRQLAAADEVSGESSGLALRWVVFGGEALDPVSLKPWMERHGDGSPRLVNMYGITETTVHVTYRPVTLADAGAGHASPVGVPIPDLRVRLLDAGGSPVPVGVPGELYVGGAGVARGYLGRPGLTAERFLPDPFSAEPGARLYRSGDRARWLPSGEPEFLGRIDAQVKIRGFRVEPGEVEAVLSSHPAVREAAVVVRGGGAGAALVGYASLRAGEEDAAAGLRGWLRERLPEHMVPAAVVVLDALPLTPHGKTDRRALPAPTASDLAPGTPRVLPETEMEARIAGVWAEVLQLESVGVEDNFFDLGGHSILLVQLQGRISAAVEREVSLVDLLEHPTVRAQAASLAGTDTGSSTDEGEERGEARQAAASRRAEARRRRGR